uniref:Secreted protein n=1 Tax=Caenorhabditis tropicalis TaxID=1561998 RepID=A0A1I7SZ40_9PELO
MLRSPPLLSTLLQNAASSQNTYRPARVLFPRLNDDHHERGIHSAQVTFKSYYISRRPLTEYYPTYDSTINNSLSVNSTIY